MTSDPTPGDSAPRPSAGLSRGSRGSPAPSRWGGALQGLVTSCAGDLVDLLQQPAELQPAVPSARGGFHRRREGASEHGLCPPTPALPSAAPLASGLARALLGSPSHSASLPSASFHPDPRSVTRDSPQREPGKGRGLFIPGPPNKVPEAAGTFCPGRAILLGMWFVPRVQAQGAWFPVHWY